MSPELFVILVLICSVLAGLVGSLTGLGGGGILTPLLVIAFGVDMKYAIGASLVAVVATSSGAAAAYVRDGFTNVRLAMILEVATVAGAVVGAIVAAYLPIAVISLIFGAVMLWTAFNTVMQTKKSADAQSTSASADNGPVDPISTKLSLDSTYPTANGLQTYRVHHVKTGFAIMFGAGILSALVGIGSGIVKVLAMDRIMRLPFKVSTTTSNFMIGVTAAASAGVYLHRGQIEPTVAAPVAIGALAGSFIGAKLLARMPVKILRILFAIIVGIAAVQMVWKGLHT
ncbi:MAG: sulfite exporter TauE/SafE family protein [Phycisphaerales bacterium]